ncbi:HEAT repeat domain-containing protein [Pyxidicoccus parkwayensis]|uniref:HEAT repeat domain-containing protein n=1 Tax=Pyxidicoccus parkwayensis TaxID=2813578 RepID=A0ABX7P9D6_9BACT|nr:HEAT repeat domain-containing protein [Pyxidicoccus parkwaysis]QSQ27059.1 HEAT repeat domain-containing protein [Pyxidicoccus parkwaysis]
MTSRHLPRAAIAGCVLVILAAVGVVLLRREASSSQDAPSAASGTSAQAVSSAAPTGTAPSAPSTHKDGPREQIPMPGCWEGLLELDKSASLDSLRAALAEAIGANDRFLAEYLKERLTEVVGNDAARGLQLVEWAAAANGPETSLYLEALKAAPAVRNPAVAERLLKLGEDKRAQIATRAAALDTLETQHRFTPESIQRLKAIAMDVDADSAAWLATRTLGRVMKEDYERTGNYASYWKELLDIGQTSKDLAVRQLALEMPSYSNPLLDSDSVDQLAELMKKDPDRQVREMSAFRLARTEDPKKALEAYRSAFDTEPSICVRFAMMLYALRAAGADALPLAAEFARKDPRLQQDYVDFKELYAAGTVDWARIWMNKKEYHECVVEEGAPHE